MLYYIESYVHVIKSAYFWTLNETIICYFDLKINNLKIRDETIINDILNPFI